MSVLLSLTFYLFWTFSKKFDVHSKLEFNKIQENKILIVKSYGKHNLKVKLKYVWIKAGQHRTVNHNTKPRCCQWNWLWMNYTNKMISDKFLKTSVDSKCSIKFKFSKNIFRSKKISKIQWKYVYCILKKPDEKFNQFVFQQLWIICVKQSADIQTDFWKKKTKIIESVCFRYDEEKQHLWRKQITFEGK